MSPSRNIGGTCPPCPIGIDAPGYCKVAVRSDDTSLVRTDGEIEPAASHGGLSVTRQGSLDPSTAAAVLLIKPTCSCCINKMWGRVVCHRLIPNGPRRIVTASNIFHTHIQEPWTAPTQFAKRLLRLCLSSRLHRVTKNNRQ